MKGKSHDESYLGRKLLNVLNNYNLKNVIKKPTRITEKTSTIIDLIITSDTSKIITSGCYDTGISDHNIVYSVINLKRKKSKPVIKEVCNYKKIDFDALRTDFEQASWYICSLFEDIDDITWTWETLYKEIMKDHAPKRKAKIRTDSLPWMNASVRKTMNKRYKQLLKAKQTKDPEDWKQYKKIRNYTTKLCRITESNYWKTKLENAKTTKEFWAVVKTMQGTKKHTK